MKRKNIKRNALVTSILSLLLCVSMLVGTTFAWFTDEVVSGVNTIAAGNLDIELLANNEPVTENTKLFTVGENQLWEPGVVVYENLEIKNVGSLALKYQMTLAPYAENATTAGNKLSEVVKIAVVEKIAENATRAEVLAAAKASTKVGTLADFSLEGALNAGETTGVAGVVVFWEPNDNETDNLYNLKNGLKTTDEKPLFIEFSVKLFATQQMKEEDSFGPDYDGAAAWTTLADTDWYFADPEAAEFTIYSAEELAGFAALVNGTATAPATTFAADSAATVTDSFKGQTVKLGGNIDLAGHPWTPAGNWDNAFEGTFDGQGYTINNLYINDAEGEGIGLFGVAAGATIKGVTVNNVNISAYSMVATVVGAAYPATISDCHVTGSVNIVADWAYVGGISGYNYYGTQIDSCSTVAAGTGLIKSNTRNAVGGITAWLLEGDHKVTNCQVKNLDLVGWTNVGGITGFVHYSNTIDNCSVENVDLVKTRVDGNPGIGLIAGGFSYNAAKASTLSNNTVKNATMEGTHVAYSAYNELYGSEYGGEAAANFVLENNVTENITNNLVEIVKASSASLKDDVKEANANVYVPKGTYTFPSGVAAGVTLTCEEGTVFTGVSSLNVNGATVIGATFKNDGSAVKGNTNGTFVDCVFEGSEALRWCYSAAGTTTVFENCVIKTDFRGFHYDDLAGEVIFRNCEINGFNAYGGDGTVTFEDCTFGCDESSYNGLNIYANTNLINCEFVYTSGKTNFVDMEGTGKTLTITGCTATLDGAAANVADFVGGSKLAENTVIYN